MRTTRYGHDRTRRKEQEPVTIFSNCFLSCLKMLLTRKDCVVAVGGGVVGDLSGFAAACYMRGIRFLQHSHNSSFADRFVRRRKDRS